MECDILARQPSILILDSYQLFGLGFKTLAETFDLDHGMTLLSDLQSVLHELESNPSIKLAIVDLSAPGMRGSASIGMLRTKFPQLAILVVSAGLSREIILECLANGAYGCVMKTQSGAEIATAIKTVLAGGVYVPASVFNQFLTLAVPAPPQDGQDPIGPLNEPGRAIAAQLPTDPHLSKQQRIVHRLLLRGLSNKAIAHELQLAEGTIKVHISGIFKALNVNSRVQLVVRSAENRLDAQLGEGGLSGK